MDDRFMMTPLNNERLPPYPRYYYYVKCVECMLHLITPSHIQHTSSHTKSVSIKMIKIFK